MRLRHGRTYKLRLENCTCLLLVGIRLKRQVIMRTQKTSESKQKQLDMIDWVRRRHDRSLGRKGDHAVKEKDLLEICKLEE